MRNTARFVRTRSFQAGFFSYGNAAQSVINDSRLDTIPLRRMRFLYFFFSIQAVLDEALCEEGPSD